MRRGSRKINGALIRAGAVALLAVLALAPLVTPASAVEPPAGTWTPTAERQKAGGTAVLLSGPACRSAAPAGYCGKVLLAGGPTLLATGEVFDQTTELYDPKTGTWAGCATDAAAGCGSSTQPAKVNLARTAPTLTVLDGPACSGSSAPAYCGKVLLVGGPHDDSELYDPATGKWATCTAAAANAGCPAPYPNGDTVRKHTATLLADGRVLVAGGRGGDITIDESRADFHIYDPTSGKWSLPGVLYNRRQAHQAVLLQGGAERCAENCGKVLVVGGDSTAVGRTAELITPGPVPTTPGVSVATPPLTASRGAGHSATLLRSGEVLVAGGYRSCVSASCGTPQKETERFYPTAGPLGGWFPGDPLLVQRADHTATLLANDKLLIAGGTSYQGAPSTPIAPELYDPATGKSAFTGPGPRSATSATLLPSGPSSVCGTSCGKVLVTNDSKSGQLYTPTPELTKLAPASGPDTGGTVVTLEGTGLASVTSVKFGALEAESISSVAATPDTKLVVTAPPQPAGAVPVTAISGGGTSASGPSTQFTYTGASAGTGGGDPALVVAAPGDGGVQTTTPLPPLPGAGDSAAAAAALAAERLRRSAFRACLVRAARHTRLDLSATRRGSLRVRALARRHLRRHRAAMRRRCVARHGRTPGRVTGLSASAAVRKEVVLSFRAPGTDGNRPPPARGYLVKQSTSPITDLRSFRRAQTLCSGTCRFPATLGEPVNLRITDLRPKRNYYYAVAARDNVTRRLGPRSLTVRVRTK